MKSHIIGFLLVTLAQIPMPIKIGTTFPNKLRPSDHGPLAIRLVETLCGTDNTEAELAAWARATAAVREALGLRKALWDSVLQTARGNTVY